MVHRVFLTALPMGTLSRGGNWLIMVKLGRKRLDSRLHIMKGLDRIQSRSE
jgi:hypothetical protein